MASTLYEFYGGKLPSIQERAKTYEAQGLGSASTYQGSYDQNVALLGKLQATPAPQPTQTQAAAIPATSLNQQQQVMNVPPEPVQQQPDLTAILADAMRLQNQQSPEQQKLSQQDQTLSGQLEQMILASGNKGARKAELEQQAGLPQLGQQLNEINSQIRAINSSAFAATQTAENRLAPTFAITGEQAAIERQKSVQTYGLAAASQALQGNIALAQDNIQRALDSEFSQIEAKTKYYEYALNRNRDLMDKEDQKKADALTLALRQYEQQVAEQKQNKQSVYEVLLAAAQGGADNQTMQAIQNAKTPEQALAIASQAGVFESQKSQPASVQEYEYAKEQGYTGSFTDYQNEDANRKKSIAAAGVANAYGLTPKDQVIFNSLVDKYNKSPLVAANDRAKILRDVTTSLKNDPSNAALQISFIYSLIQALDTYQSAVREGEIGLLEGTQGLGDKIANLPNKIQNGTPLSVNKVNEYLGVADLLTSSIGDAAKKKASDFGTQAKINSPSLGDAFGEFVSLTNPEQENDPLGIGSQGQSNSNPLGI